MNHSALLSGCRTPFEWVTGREGKNQRAPKVRAGVVDLSISIGDVASIIVVIGGFAGFAWWLNRKLENHTREHVAAATLLSLLVQEATARNSSFKNQMAGFDTLLRAWEKKHAEAGNPITAEQAQRRQDLSARLQTGETLPYSDLMELQGILQEELADAQQTNADLVIVIALVFLIGLVVAAMALAARG